MRRGPARRVEDGAVGEFEDQDPEDPVPKGAEDGRLVQADAERDGEDEVEEDAGGGRDQDQEDCARDEALADLTRQTKQRKVREDAV